MADPFDEFLASIPGGTPSNPYQQMNGSQTRAAGSMNNISPGPPVGTPPLGGNPSSQPVPMSAQQIALLIAMNTPQAYQPGMAAPGSVIPSGPPIGTGVNPGDPSMTGVTPMPGQTLQGNMPLIAPLVPNGPHGAAQIVSALGGGGGYSTPADQLIPGDPGYGGTPSGGMGFVTAPQVSPYGSSGLPVNQSVLNANIWDNPQMALLLSGVADPNTPGYNNLANLGFDPLAVYYASGGSPSTTTGTDYAQWLANMYATLGTRSDQGGGSITAGPLLQNLVNMPKNSELWKMMKDDPTVFYTMATSVMEAGGMSPMAQSAFKSQMAQLYTEYLAYTASVTKEGDTMVISDWIRSKHPEVVASWGGGG